MKVNARSAILTPILSAFFCPSSLLQKNDFKKNEEEAVFVATNVWIHKVFSKVILKMLLLINMVK